MPPWGSGRVTCVKTLYTSIPFFSCLSTEEVPLVVVLVVVAAGRKPFLQEFQHLLGGGVIHSIHSPPAGSKGGNHETQYELSRPTKGVARVEDRPRPAQYHVPGIRFDLVCVIVWHTVLVHAPINKWKASAPPDSSFFFSFGRLDM